ncbi:nucleotidyltransferase family protein [Sporichthya sp.]|uniref:nucleotidyltransferase family protein n=1 Tax=Sporichthya sp. TaxID=65475 RepID=UPI001797498E|nr:nucleotidyltransferase family protein [Sporichthya sp.]MBA3742761.1 nucleotidyltransferase family protein [Sporichthya sp.]
MTVAGLVLAAGSGSRLGQPKALVEIAGVRLVDRAVRVLRDGGCDPVVVVSGAAPFDVAGASVVANPAWATGMGSSLRVGLAVLAGGTARAAVISLVDQPGIPAAVVSRLLAAHADGAIVATATYGGKRRNPVLLDRATWAEVSRLAEGDQGARPYLAAHPDQITGVECDDLGDAADIDTPEDLARARGGADGAAGC